MIQRVGLVAMPWSSLSRPSAAIGALAPYLRQQVPGLHVECFSEFLNVAQAVGQDVYECIADDFTGDLLYMPQLYPEKQASVAEWFAQRWADAPDMIAAWPQLQQALPQHVDDLARRLVDAGLDLIGMTTSFCQLFANLALARRIKSLAPHIVIVLGGSTISSRAGPAIMQEYPFVDHVVQGEGEQPLTALVRGMTGAGVLSRNGSTAPARLSEVSDMDHLPIPDFDEYAEKAEAIGLDWILPLEGSRGCWWDRARRTGNPKATCYFCNLNVQWSGYREKSVPRVVQELHQLSDRYDRVRVFFLDNIMRHRGAEALAMGIRRLGRDFELFYEMRASITPHQILLLREAGLAEVQFGIEGLSTSFLKRIGKGTATIQNLQAMKICYELGIEHNANLIVDFPGSTEAEVAETVDVIRRFAVIYSPLHNSRFHLGVDSTVDRLPADFGISRVRNWDVYRAGLPDDVYQRVQFLDLSFDCDTVDWTPVREACRVWRERHDASRHPLLTYRDGRRFIEIIDRREEPVQVYTLYGLHRKLLLACMEIARDQDLRSLGPAAEVEEALQELIDRDLIFAEDGRYLTVAVAPSPYVAARRIRRARPKKESLPDQNGKEIHQFVARTPVLQPA